MKSKQEGQGSAEQVVKAIKLNSSELLALKHLVKISAEFDKYEIKLYWELLENRQLLDYSDFLYYRQNQLLGYLGLFHFKQEAELTAVVHPAYRHQGIFTRLLQEVIAKLQERNIISCVCLCHPSAKTTRHYLKALKAIYLYAILEMSAITEPKMKDLPQINLIQAKVEDAALLSQIGALSFGSDFSEVFERITANMQVANRQAWFATVGDHIVGKIHLHYRGNTTAFIHDLCVLPNYRNQHFATAMVINTLRKLHKAGYCDIRLEMKQTNYSALRLYEHCGFRTTATHEVWQVKRDNLALFFRKKSGRGHR